MSFTRKDIIRLLTITSLLIFFLPFFQTCSDKTLKEENSFFKSHRIAKTETEKENAFQKSKKDFTLSGYELATSFEPIFLSFTAIMILNFTSFIFVLRGHKNLLFLCFLNLTCILFSFITLIFALPGFGQIRYGMYACLINSLILFYFVYKEQETAYNRR